MSKDESNKRTDIDCCVVCSEATNRIPTLNRRRKIHKIGTCEFCINAHFRQYKPQLGLCRQTMAWKCLLCSDIQAATTPAHAVPFCIICLVQFVRDQDKEVRDYREAKISFLQYEPSPLRDDFTGDVSLVVEGSDKYIQARRYVLMRKSPVLKAMMEIDMKEKLTGIIHIKGMSAAVVQAAVNFMYSGEIEFSDQVLPEDVLRFAHQYEIQFLKMLCEEQLVGKVTAENFAQMFSIGDEFGLETLKEKATACFTTCVVDHPNDHKSLLETLLRTASSMRGLQHLV